MKKRITSTGARNTLLGLWSSFLIINLGIVLYMYLDDWIERDTLWASLSQLNSLYVTYLGVMIAFYFTGVITENPKPKEKRYAGGAFWIALTGSAIWNLVIFVLILKAFYLRGDKQTAYGIENAAKDIGQVGPLLSWIVAPAIGYYFGASANTQTSPNHH